MYKVPRVIKGYKHCHSICLNVKLLSLLDFNLSNVCILYFEIEWFLSSWKHKGGYPAYKNTATHAWRVITN